MYQRKTDGPSCVLAWVIVGVLINIFIVAFFFFFWWLWVAQDLEVSQRACVVKPHVDLGDRLVAMVFEVREASSRAAVAR
jgi:hypothetical protein